MVLFRRRPAAGPERGPAAPDPTEGTTPIASAVPRTPVRVVGEVTRIRSRPATGLPSLAVTITDPTGSVVAVWTGRRSIGGITLGRRIIVEGVAMRRSDQLEFTNPAYTLLP